MTVIEARGLRKAFGTTVAVDNVNLHVEGGRILGLIGPDGAGKTTALNAILGLIPYQGGLRVLGRDPWTERDRLVRGVAAKPRSFPVRTSPANASRSIRGFRFRFDERSTAGLRGCIVERSVMTPAALGGRTNGTILLLEPEAHVAARQCRITCGVKPHNDAVRDARSETYPMRESKRPLSLRVPSWWKMACAIVTVCVLAAAVAPAQTFISLYSFCPQTGCADGDGPLAGLVQANNGDLYGTTYLGSTLFKITPEGAFTAVYRFCFGSDCPAGFGPAAPLVQDTNGDLYGTAYDGGETNDCELGCGTVFKLPPGGKLTLLQKFDFTDGANPYAGLIQGTSGELYGTTTLGGAYGRGTVFEVTPSGTLTTLHSFCEGGNCGGGAESYTALVQGTDGNFYGTTAEGGEGEACAGGRTNGCGTVFKMKPDGVATVLWDFCGRTGCPDGVGPSALLQASDGNFYGTTQGGGIGGACTYSYGCGTIFKITPTGGLTTLYNFCSQANCADGAYPYAGLVQGTDGNLYGTTDEGGLGYAGVNPGGTIYKITTAGLLTTLYNFCSQESCEDGTEPTGPLVQNTNGNFYGTTFAGGTGGSCGSPGCGTVFSLSVGLGPFVETQPGSGKVGAPVRILGTNLTGATSVAFNGTAATFTVVSPSLITTTVPASATTGAVQVVTPGGTLSSNVPFRVIP